MALFSGIKSWSDVVPLILALKAFKWPFQDAILCNYGQLYAKFKIPERPGTHLGPYLALEGLVHASFYPNFTLDKHGQRPFFLFCVVIFSFFVIFVTRGEESGPEIYISFPRNLASSETIMVPFGLQTPINVEFGNVICTWLAKGFKIIPHLCIFPTRNITWSCL